MTIVLKIKQILTQNERKRAAVLLGLMLIGMLLEMLGIGIIIPAMTLLMRSDTTAQMPIFESLFNFNPNQTQLMIIVMTFLVIVYLVKNIFLAFLAWQQTRFAFDMQAAISQRLYSNYMKQPYAFHLQKNSAELIRNVISEVNLFTARALIPGMLLLTEGLVVLGVGVLLFVIEPLGTFVVSFVTGGAAWLFYRSTQARINKWGVARQYHEGLRLQHLQQGLGGIKDVKVLGREEEFLKQYQEHNIESAKAAQYQFTLQQMPRLTLEILAVGALAFLVIVMMGQGRNITQIAPTLGVFAAAAFRLMPSVNRLLSAMQALKFTLPVVDTLYFELKSNVEEIPFKQFKSDVVFTHKLTLNKIGFEYPDSTKPALHDITFTVTKGETIGFVGSSGSGKSTLVDLILGLHKPSEGEVLVDGECIENKLRAWQNQLGYVPQTIYLTDDTLRRNIAFGLPPDKIDDVTVNRVIKAAQLNKFVEGLPDGLNTIVGERGVRLSGGQRQRIGIARALYHDPSVLILDEATSALDNTTEQGVMQSVDALHGQKTIIIIAHRLTTVEGCDRIYELKDGGVVNQGSASDMLIQMKC